jgi:nucleoside-diphosphate-sugar epimerase
MAKALVTGATGFIGGHIVDVLQEQGHDVTALVRATSDTTHLREREVRLATGDVTDSDSLRVACSGMEWVFHTAAVVGTYGKWAHFREVGVRGTKHVIDAAASAGASRFVHLGSIAVYGTRPRTEPSTEDTPYDEHPERWNHYVREKVLSEKLLWKAHGEGCIQATSIRPSVVVGPRDRNAIPRTLAIIRSPLGALAGRPDNRLPTVVVEELSAAIVKAASTEAAIGKAYNLSGRETITQLDFMRLYAEAAGLKPKKRAVPYGMALASAGVLEGLYRLGRRKNEPFITRIVVAIAGHDYAIDCSRAVADLGWEGKADYADAIRRSVEWYRAQPGAKV